METHIPTREEALALVKEYNSNPSLINHALAVEGVMRYMAKKSGEDEEKWGIVGLAHDLDYERFPEQHCQKTQEILQERGWPADYIRAIMAHGWELRTDVKPETNIEKTLYAVDELVGFMVACALVRPSKSVMDLEVSSARKKWKNRNFAAGADRDVIQKGCDLLGVTLDSLMADVIAGMRTIAPSIGL
jgi:predicted hydrolase (HD superfamily)